MPSPSWPDALRLLRGDGAADARVLLVAAHPDDETIGAGARLHRLPKLRILHLTDGAPLERRWWGDPALASREIYARCRREELTTALALAGVGEDRLRALGIPDQHASDDLAALARAVRLEIEAWAPALVLTHPYEGGHPDHDAACFAVHLACRALCAEGRAAPQVVEFASYHLDSNGALRTGAFLGRARAAFRLSAGERALKRRMLACFRTQQRTLAPFSVAVERFRPAPTYDFTRAPHEGPLNYERFDWGITGREWRERAMEIAHS